MALPARSNHPNKSKSGSKSVSALSTRSIPCSRAVLLLRLQPEKIFAEEFRSIPPNCRLRDQGRNIHAIPRPMSHPKIPRSGNKMRKKMTIMPHP
jgi:hypothetical protein